MDVSTVIATIGGIALLVGVFGGGIQLEKVIIPPVSSAIRIISFVIGVFLIIGAVIVSKPEFLSLIPAQPSGTVAVATADPSNPLLSDNFSDPAYDDKYNTSLWNCDTCAFGNKLVFQTGNSLRLEGGNKESGGLVANKTWFSSQIGYAQWRMKLQNTNNGGLILFFNTDITSGTWSTSCEIQGSQLSTTQGVFHCYVGIHVNGQDVTEYTTEAIAVNYDEWHIIKIEFVPDNFEIHYFFDNELIGKHIPSDANELKNKVFRFAFGAYTDTNIVGYIDDVIIQPVK